jgi:hypothetical protein
MLSSQQIADIADQAARKAKRAGREPLVFESLHHVDRVYRELPNLGSYRPKGWKLEEYRTVDKYGIDFSGPAMTLPAMLAWFKGHLTDPERSGYALVEESEFQVIVGRFERQISSKV